LGFDSGLVLARVELWRSIPNSVAAIASQAYQGPIRVPFKVPETTAPASLSHLRLADTGYDL